MINDDEFEGKDQEKTHMEMQRESSRKRGLNKHTCIYINMHLHNICHQSRGYNHISMLIMLLLLCSCTILIITVRMVSHFTA